MTPFLRRPTVVVLLSLALACAGLVGLQQTHTFPALDTVNVFTNTNTFNGTTILNGLVNLFNRLTSSDIVSSGPWIDVRYYGASGSSETTTFTSTASSPTITLSSAIDLVNGEGVNLAGAGVQQTFPTAPSPTVTPEGTTGSTAYCYVLVEFDASEGTSAPGTKTCISNGYASLGDGDGDGQEYNQIEWYPPTGSHPLVSGYIVYAQYPNNTSTWVAVAHTDIPGYAQPWTCGTTYYANQYVVPTNFQTSSPSNQNGHFYKANGTGTSAACQAAPYQNNGQPSFCTSSNGCTTTDNGVTWTEQPLVWDDTQAVALLSSYFPGSTNGWSWMLPSYLNASPPSAQSDALVTTISSGGGTNTLTLAASPSQTITSGQSCGLPSVGSTGSRGCLSHDDTSAILAAIAADNASCINTFALDNNATCKRLWFPNGIYSVSSQLLFGSYLYIGGESRSTVASTNPALDIFYSTSAYNVMVDGLRTFGGRTHYDLANSDLNNSTYKFTNVTAQIAEDFAFSFNDQSGTNTLQCLCLGNRRTLFTNGYTHVLAGTWVEGSVYNWFPNEADFTNYVTGYMSWDNVLTVPGAIIPFRRMIDNWTSLDINKSRVGGEGPNACIYNFGGYLGPGAPGASTYYGGSISIKNTAVACAEFNSAAHPDYGVIVLMNQDFPSAIDIENVNNATQTQLFNYSFTDQFGVAQGTNLDSVFNTYYYGTTTAPDGVFNIFCNSGQNAPVLCLGGNPSGVPAQLVNLFHPLEARQWYSAGNSAPNAGLWNAGGASNPTSLVLNQTVGSGVPMGWVPSVTGRASPSRQTSHQYALTTTPAGTGNDYVSYSGYTYYVSACAGSGSTYCKSSATATGSIFTSGSHATCSTLGGVSNSTTTDGNVTWACEGANVETFLPFGQPSCSGTSAAMSSGTVTVTAACITGTNPIILSPATKGGTQGTLSYTVSAGSLVISSTSSSDTSTVSWVQN